MVDVVDADNFTYSKGHLGLLSALGASLGISFSCAPAALVVYRHCRLMFVEYVTHDHEMATD